MMGEQIQTQREYTEFDESNKIRYMIVYETNPEFENEIIKKIKMEKRWLPLWPTAGNYARIVWEIDYSNPTEVVISVWSSRENWNGTGSDRIADVTANFYFEEDPWFLVTKDLEEHIKDHGVKETIKAVLHDLLWYFRDGLRIEREE
jgi:hypothetical protein